MLESVEYLKFRSSIKSTLQLWTSFANPDPFFWGSTRVVPQGQNLGQIRIGLVGFIWLRYLGHYSKKGLIISFRRYQSSRSCWEQPRTPYYTLTKMTETLAVAACC